MVRLNFVFKSSESLPKYGRTKVKIFLINNLFKKLFNALNGEVFGIIIELEYCL